MIRNEENLAEEGRYTFTLAGIAGTLVVFIIIFASAVYFLAGKLGDSSFRNTGVTLENRKLLGELVKETDSLNKELEAYALYYNNLNQILAQSQGLYASENTDIADSNSIDLNDSTFFTLTEEELALRKEFESPEGQDLLTISSSEGTNISKMLLFQPVEGIVTDPFDASIAHYGVDIVSRKNEPVKSIAEGTVIMANWTEDAGHVLAIQHQNNLISVYKHNSSLTSNLGDQVKAGEIVAIMGNSGERSSGPHLHFELWQEGKPLDPAQYLSF